MWVDRSVLQAQGVDSWLHAHSVCVWEPRLNEDTWGMVQHQHSVPAPSGQKCHAVCVHGRGEGYNASRPSNTSCFALLRHASSSPQGVQFHPESIITQSGMKIVENFVKALPQ